MSVENEGFSGGQERSLGGFHPLQYFREVAIEWKRVRWPNRREMIGYTTTVVSVCVVMFVLTYAFDLLVTQGFKLLGIGVQ